MKVAEWLKIAEIRKIEDLDDPSITQLHKLIIRRKKFLNKLYNDWYKEFKIVTDKTGGKPVVEVGSGGGFLKDIIPHVITSDILPLADIDINFSVSKMPFKSNTIGAFFMLDVLHHIKEPFIFLKELNRCLSKGGKIIMIEPANTLWGRFIWKNFHHENFDPLSGWAIEGNGPLSSANSAIPWIIFFRDRERFEKEFPSLNINKIRFHTPFRYLISGGFSVRQLLPSCAYGLIKSVEFILSWLNKYIGLFLTIEIEKISYSKDGC